MVFSVLAMKHYMVFLEKEIVAVFGQAHALPSELLGLMLRQIRPHITATAALKTVQSSLHTVTHQCPKDPKAPEEPVYTLSSARETRYDGKQAQTQNTFLFLCIAHLNPGATSSPAKGAWT